MKNHKSTSTTFATQSTNVRPKTSYISRNRKVTNQQLVLDPQVNPVVKIKTYKQDIKKLQLQYQRTLARFNQSKKIIGQQYRQSQKMKVQFLNLYQNRKLKLFQQKLLQQKKKNQDSYKTELKQKAKTMKLNQQIRSLLLKNQIEETQIQLYTKNKSEKQKLRDQLSKSREKNFQVARESFQRIRTGESDLHNRRKRISEMQLVIAKQNYLRKVSDELNFIDNYDKLLNGMGEDESWGQNCAEESKSFFLTNKK